MDLGHSLLLDDGDLVLEHGRLTEIAGLPNLAQALTTRVLTPLGGDVFNTRYGFDAAAVFGHAGTAGGVADLIRLNLVRALGDDPRVAEIRDITLRPRADRRSWTAEVSIVTADGRPLAVALRVGA